MERSRSIYKVTILGGIINVVLLAFKFVAGILGHSSAMVADAIHSLSDFLTDVVVLVFVKVSNRPADGDHAYGHGKFETLATLVIAVALLVVGVELAIDGGEKILRAYHGEVLPQPGWIAFWAAVASVILKELTYQITARVGRETKSEVVVANAWHHRSDAFSSIGTTLGIGGAIFLGESWRVLDPIAGCIVSVVIVSIAIGLAKKALTELLEHSLPDEVIEEIKQIVNEDPLFSELHDLRTRNVGNHYAIEMHVRMAGDISLYESHRHTEWLEERLKKRFGESTHIGIHVEPIEEEEDTKQTT